MERYSRKWRSLHLYLHDYEKQERFLIDCVRPLVREISETFDQWFFIRYWEGGPHLRVRFLGVSDSSFDQLRSSLATQAAGYLTEGSDRSVTEESGIFVAPREEWQKDGSVAEAEYEPEFDRYGGYHAMQYSEDAFCYSSALSLQLIDHTQASLSQRLMLSVDLLLAAGFVLNKDLPSLRAFFRRHSGFWRRTLGDGSPSDEMVEAMVVTSRSRVQNVMAQLESGNAAQYLSAWVQILEKLVGKLAELEEKQLLLIAERITLEDEGEAQSSERAFAYVVNSHLHMMSNRLGVSPFHECAIADCIARSLD